MRGYVKQLPEAGRPGIIVAKKQEYTFELGDVAKPEQHLLVERAKVEFTPIGKPHFRAQQVHLTGGHKQPPRSPQRGRKSQDQMQAQSRPVAGFVNPYNFVPLVGKVARSEPASHELWRGYSGKIECQIQLKSPFFFPDPEQRIREPSGHESLRLLRDSEHHVIIPGSELKGIFSSVAEVLANGCLRVFDETLHYGYRPRPEDFLLRKKKQRLWQPGIVKALPRDGRPRMIAPCEVAKVPFDKERSFSSSKDQVGDARNGQTLNLEVHGTWAVCPTGNTSASTGRMKITDVPDIRKEKARKKSQSWFYNEERDPHKWLGFTEDVQANYDAVHATGFRRDARDSKFEVVQVVRGREVKHKWADAAREAGGLRPPREPLQVGDLVYCVLRKPLDNMSDEQRQTDAVEMILAAQVGRVRYKQGVRDGLPRAFQTCTNHQHLCRVCRLWGWVAPEQREQPREEDDEVNRQGLIRFSTARTTAVPGADAVQQDVVLAPLGQPQASNMPFYLQKPGAVQKAGSYGKQDESVEPFVLRGRKFYWHQTPNAQWVDTREVDRKPKKDNQNKTVELLKQGTFEFSVEFDNLSRADLGLLFLTLQPNLLGEGNIPSQELYHHLGMGKPLGLGSAEVRVTSLMLVDRATRYQDLMSTGQTCYDESQLPQRVQEFIDAFVAEELKAQSVTAKPSHERKQFADLEHVRALLLLLDWEMKPSQVQYPPGHPDAPEEGFRWFADHPNECLLTPHQIVVKGKKQTDDVRT